MGRVRTHMVVVEPPALDDSPGFWQGFEDLLVQAFVAQPAVEAFDEAVLLRLAGRDVVPIITGAVGPFQHGPCFPCPW